MTVEMMLPNTVTDVYLEGLKEYGKEMGKFDSLRLIPLFKKKTSVRQTGNEWKHSYRMDIYMM